jgi:hypothetical protein
MTDKELSDLTFSRVECVKCGAIWMNGQHIWTGTGKKTDNSEIDLAGLVCNVYGDDTCVNPSKGLEGGDTWKRRSETAEVLAKEWEV